MKVCNGKKKGFTLIELGVVVLVLALLSSLAAQRFAHARRNAEITVAEADMAAIRDAFVGTSSTPGYLDDMRSIPGFTPGYLRVANLLVSTNLYAFEEKRVDLDGVDGIAPPAAFTNWSDAGRRGWRGPYISMSSARSMGARFPARDEGDSSFFPAGLGALSLPREYAPGYVYGFPGEPSLTDPWGNPYILQIPPAQAFAGDSGSYEGVTDEQRFLFARIVSAGPDGVVSTPCFFGNTNATGSSWSAPAKRDSKYAGHAGDRGDDLVLFLNRADFYEEDER